MTSNRMGVVLVMAHAVITLAFIGVYLYSIVKGHPDQTTQTILTAIVGYWFGALGFNKLSGGSTSDNNANVPTAGNQAGGKE